MQEGHLPELAGNHLEPEEAALVGSPLELAGNHLEPEGAALVGSPLELVELVPEDSLLVQEGNPHLPEGRFLELEPGSQLEQGAAHLGQGGNLAVVVVAAAYRVAEHPQVFVQSMDHFQLPALLQDLLQVHLMK